jgi:hypothetical protein
VKRGYGTGRLEVKLSGEKKIYRLVNFGLFIPALLTGVIEKNRDELFYSSFSHCCGHQPWNTAGSIQYYVDYRLLYVEYFKAVIL